MAREKSFSRPERLSREQRIKIFDKTEQTVLRSYFDPRFNGSGWPERAKRERGRIVSIEDPQAQAALFQEILSGRFTVRDAEQSAAALAEARGKIGTRPG